MPVDCPGHADHRNERRRQPTLSDKWISLEGDLAKLATRRDDIENRIQAARQRHATRRRLTLLGAPS